MAIKMTLEEFCKQWEGKVDQIIAHNTFEFTTKAGVTLQDCFKKSFAEGGMYGSGTKWPARKSKWGTIKFPNHPVMNDTGTLRDSIRKYVFVPEKKGEKDPITRYNDAFRKERVRAQYCIETSEISIPEKGKRGRKKGQDQSYAAVHNTNPALGLYKKNQYSDDAPEYRPFMVHNKTTEEILDSLVPMIFKDLPGDFA